MKSRYIIFADDDADDLEEIVGYFKEFNQSVQILQFKDGKEVLNFLDQSMATYSAPILIVLDINMPRLNGKDTLTQLRKQQAYQNIPVVIYTTAQNSVDETFCRNLGASWVTKPPTTDGVKQTAKVLAEFCELQR